MIPKAPEIPVNVYLHGMFSCSVCAESSLTPEQVEAKVNEINPAGPGLEWKVSKDPTFKGGRPNPCPCDQRHDRTHYLMDR